MNVGEIYHGLKLLAYCGGGAYGEVYYCEDLTHKRMAIKILSKLKIGEHWKRELKGITNYRKLTFDVPNLLKIFQVGEDKDYFYYTMEAADSYSPSEYKADTLSSRLQRGTIAQKDIFPIIHSIFAGIKAIHFAGFSHRDIKPDNILFVNGIPKLADLGLLSSLNATMTTLAGTFEFLPPEIRSSAQIESYDNHSRQQCDLYALGKVIYSITTGLDVQFFPSIPENIIPSLQVKLFMRLSLELCNNIPQKRLTSLAFVEKRLFTIERQLICGENWKDKIQYAMWQSRIYDKSELGELRRMSAKKWTFIFALFSTTFAMHWGFTLEGQDMSLIHAGPIGIVAGFLFFWLCSYVIVDIVKKINRLFYPK